VIYSENGDPNLGARGLGLLGTMPGLIILYIAMNLSIAVWMLRSFFEEVPRDVLDAARVDGAGVMREMTQIVLPMVTPGIAATVFISIIFAWNEFFFAFNLAATGTSTVPMFMVRFVTARRALLGKLAASSTMACSRSSSSAGSPSGNWCAAVEGGRQVGRPADAAEDDDRGDDLCFLAGDRAGAAGPGAGVSAVDLMRAHLDRIERVNPAVNALVTWVPSGRWPGRKRRTRRCPRRGTGAAHGLPVVHKDLMATAGIRTTSARRSTPTSCRTADALIVQRLRAAGAITLAKTNTPEFGAGSQTFIAVFGTTLIPYDRDQNLRRLLRRGGGRPGLRHGADRRRQRSGGSLRNPPPSATSSACGQRRGGYRAGRARRPGSPSRAGADGADRGRRRPPAERDGGAGRPRSRSPGPSR
jgi:hypothetical protein